MPRAKTIICNRIDCFSYKDGKCKLLTRVIENCTFYKTHEQAEKDKTKKEDAYTIWLRRIERQDKINKGRIK